MDDDTVIVADFDIVRRKRIAREAILMLLLLFVLILILKLLPLVNVKYRTESP